MTMVQALAGYLGGLGLAVVIAFAFARWRKDR